jgi:Acetyltransferase (GNAT) family
MVTEESAIQIVLVEGLNHTPALDLAMRGWAECVEKGLGDGTMNVYASLNAFIALAPNGREMIPAAVMTWDYDKGLKRVWIFQSYTLPEFRGRGLYNALWAKMVQHAVDVLKASRIESGTHSRNSAMRAIARKQGRTEESVVLSFNLD